MSRSLYTLCALLLAALLAACSGSATPRMIASYPSGEKAGPPIAPPQSQGVFIYNATLELEVWDVQGTAEKAQELAVGYGGYLSKWDSWQQDSQTVTRVTLVVPAPYYSSLYDDLLRLGTLRNQYTSGEWVEGRHGWNAYSEISVTLYPRFVAWPRISFPDIRWNPARTFSRALGVFWSIFGFVIDVLIWLLVVVGPFILIGLALRFLLKRWRK